MATVSTTEAREIIAEALYQLADEAGLDLSLSSYGEAGILTTDEGIVLDLGDSEFQVTIVRSK